MVGYPPGVIGKDALQHRGKAQEAHGEAGFFGDFPGDGGGQGLPQLHQAAGEAPGIPGRLLAPAHQEDFLALKDHRAHAGQGLIGVVAFDPASG